MMSDETIRYLASFLYANLPSFPSEATLEQLLREFNDTLP